MRCSRDSMAKAYIFMLSSTILFLVYVVAFVLCKREHVLVAHHRVRILLHVQHLERRSSRFQGRSICNNVTQYALMVSKVGCHYRELYHRFMRCCHVRLCTRMLTTISILSQSGGQFHEHHQFAVNVSQQANRAKQSSVARKWNMLIPWLSIQQQFERFITFSDLRMSS